ncbi:MAG TPA: hypothetical protein VEN78_24495 [Bradyrhizobium sp.]|nr:hypothetical protein [Bradyrhizobium sp.]
MNRPAFLVACILLALFSVNAANPWTDIVNDGVGDDRIYGNDIVGLQAAIERGHSVSGSGQGSFDWSVSSTGNPVDRRRSPIDIANFDSDATGNDQVYGGNGNDAIFGLKGNDYLDDGAGNDVLGGDDGDDELFGGSGDDLMTDDYGSLAYDSGAGQVVQGNDYLLERMAA